jgi:hypothetical protein
MYENAPFDGVKVVEDYDHAYLMSVVTLDKAKYPSESASTRVASVKAMSQASEFFNGSNITKDMVIRTESHTNGMSDATIIEKIREKSVGYVRSLEQLINFQRQDGLTVFIFICPIEP